MKAGTFFRLAWFGAKTILLRQEKPILGTIILTDKCNLKCRHCSVNNISSVIYPYGQIRNEMEQLYAMGVRILFFCGGETFLWSDAGRTLRDLVREAKSMGFLIVNILTNGTFPIDLPEADLILLSLDGDRQRHNAIRGDTFDTIMKENCPLRSHCASASAKECSTTSFGQHTARASTRKNSKDFSASNWKACTALR